MALNLVVTNAGLAALTNAQQTGTAPIVLNRVGLGTSRYTANANQTAMQGQFKSLATVAGSVVGDNVIHIEATDKSADQYECHEVGVFTDTGVLFAIVSSQSAIIEKAAASQAMLAADFVLTGATPSSITIGDVNFSVPPATTEVQGIVELATDAETQAGTDGTRAVTPKSLNSRKATTTMTGLAEIATNAEVQTGVDNERIVTPAGLSSRTATLSRTGIVQMATDADVTAGTNTTKVVTPKQLSDKIFSRVPKSVGSNIKHVYTNANGVVVASDATVGSNVKLTYLSGGATTASNASVGSTTKPVYMENGEIKASGATVGAKNRPVYMNQGVVTPLSATVGSNVKLTYLSGGVTTASNATVGSTTKPVFMQGGEIKESNATVGDAAKPVYMNDGVISPLSATVGSGVKPTYLASGRITVSTSSVGSATKHVYMENGEIKQSSSNVGGTAKPLYLSGGVMTPCSANVGSGTKPVYMSGGQITQSSSSVGSTTKPVYMENGEIKAFDASVGSTQRPVYIVNGVLTQCVSSLTDYLPVAGGQQNGTIVANTEVIIKRKVNDGNLAIYGGTDSASGARVELYGKDRSTNPGSFLLTTATVNGSYCQLLAKPDGTITWSGAVAPVGDDSNRFATTAYVKDCLPKSIGSGVKPTYTNANGVLTASNSNVGSATKPVYMNGGEVTVSNANVGTASKPVFMQNGEIKQSNATIGSATQPVYMNNGVLTACSRIEVPVGTILHYAGTSVPAGFLYCNGGDVKKADYAALFAVIGTAYGTSSDSAKFKLPDGRNRTLWGGAKATDRGHVAAGLPNITGEVEYFDAGYVLENSNKGALKKSDNGGGGGYADTGRYDSRNHIVFDASDSNAIYGNSNTVQPPAIKGMFIIKF